MAIRVYALWGGHRTKSWLMELAARHTSHSRPGNREMRWHDLETFTTRKALRPLLKEEDAHWVLDARFTDSGWRFDQLELTLPLVPDAMFLSQLEAELASQDPERRLGALRLVRARRTFFGNRQAPTERLVSDPEVRNFALVLLHQSWLVTKPKQNGQNEHRSTEVTKNVVHASPRKPARLRSRKDRSRK